MLPAPVEAKGKPVFCARARATTSATLPMPEFRGVIITTGLSATWQTGAKFASV